MSYRSWCITIRPRDGIKEDLVEKVKKWLNRQSYSFAVLEKEGHERHLHAQVWFDEARARGDVCKQVQRIVEPCILDWDTAQKKVLRQGVKIAYSDWYLDYLAENELKEEVPNIIVNNPPPCSLDYYPSEEEQDKVKSIAKAVDQQLASYEIMCLEYLQENDFEVNKRNVAIWLAVATNDTREIKAPRAKRDCVALCDSLYYYITRSKDPSQFLKDIPQKTQDLIDAFKEMS